LNHPDASHALDLLHPSGKRPCYRRTCDKRDKIAPPENPPLGTHAKANTLAHRWSALLCGTAKWEDRCLMRVIRVEDLESAI
jgi:hypothetical protein